MQEALSNAIRVNFEKNLPFALFSQPNSRELTGLFQKVRGEFSCRSGDEGFIFAPFSSENNTLFIPLENSDLFRSEITGTHIQTSSKDISADSLQKEEYVALVQNAIERISTGELKKVVTSRKQDIQLNRFDLQELFQQLFSSNSTAFRYVWFHPESGLWVGATPETLLTISSNRYKTMSLAGTRDAEAAAKRPWTSKEYAEQQIVTDAISRELKPYSETMRIAEVRTVRAGNIEHLRSDFEGELRPGTSYMTLANSLHPTPAVCGFPKERAFEFILANEPYDRTYYTGYLGPVSIVKGRADLFVNLRCMRIENNIASIFTGGGITIDSIPEAEWEETSRKQQAMLKLLQQFL